MLRNRLLAATAAFALASAQVSSGWAALPSPAIQTPAANDNSSTAANTSFVSTAIANLQAYLVGLLGGKLDKTGVTAALPQFSGPCGTAAAGTATFNCNGLLGANNSWARQTFSSGITFDNQFLTAFSGANPYINWANNSFQLYDRTNNTLNFAINGATYKMLQSIPVSDNGPDFDTTANSQNRLSRVANAAALASWTNYAFPVERDDVPGVKYADTGASCTISGGDGGWQIQPATGHCWQAYLDKGTPLKLWTGGVIPTDMSPALTKAIAAMNAVGGGDITLAPGTWTMGSNVVLLPNVTIRGATYGGGTIIKPTFASGDVFSVGTGYTSAHHYAGLTDLSFSYGTGSTFRTSGAAIEFNGSRNVFAKNITCHVGTYVCISVDSSGFDTTLDNIITDGEHYSSIQLGCSPDNTAGGVAADTQITNSDFTYAHGAGIEMCSTSGIHIIGINTDGNIHGLWAHPGAGQYVNATDVTHTYWDVSDQESVLLDTSAGKNANGTAAVITEFVMGAETWAATAGQASSGYTPQNGAQATVASSACIKLMGPANTILHSSFDVNAFNCGGDGILALNASYVKFSGQVAQNGNAKVAGSDSGLHIGPNVSNWSWDGIAGGATSISPDAVNNNSQQYGVRVDSGNSDYYTVKGILNGNILGPISDSGVGVHKSFEGMIPAYPCMGYPVTVSAASGALGSYTASGCYINLGNKIFMSAQVNITSAGSNPSGALTVSLPRTEGVNGLSLPIQLNVAETAVNGFAGRATVAPGSSAVSVTKYDNSYLGCNGCSIVISGVYPIVTP